MARPLRDPIAESIEGLSQAIAGDRPQWQQNVTQTTEGLTSRIADSVVERVAAPLTDAIRRTVSSSRSAPLNAPRQPAAVLTSGNVMPGATFQPFQPTGEVPDLNNPPSWFNRPPARPPLPPWWETADLPTVEDRQQSTAERAAERAEEARRIVADISGGGGGQIPPAPPGGNDPPGPPDEPDDNDGILRQLLEFFQRMFGVRPDIDRSVLDTLANNLTSILGGTPAQAGADGQQPSSVATLMDTFADYFNVPRETEEATREAQENLRRSIDRLTEATTGAANGGTPSQPQTRWQRFRGIFRRSGRTRRGGIATATRIASYMRPVLSRLGNIVPTRWRQAAGQVGMNAMAQLGGRFGIPATTAARFGTALGPAAALVGGFMLILPALAQLKDTLNEWSKKARENIDRVSHYNPQLSASQAFLEMNRRQRDIGLANSMSDLGSRRILADNRMENATQPWNKFTDTIGNMWGLLKSSAASRTIEEANAGMTVAPRVLEYLGHLTKLDSLVSFARTAIEFWEGRDNAGNADPFRASEMGAWLRNEASGQEAQAQRRRAREPLGPVR